MYTRLGNIRVSDGHPVPRSGTASQHGHQFGHCKNDERHDFHHSFDAPRNPPAARKAVHGQELERPWEENGKGASFRSSQRHEVEATCKVKHHLTTQPAAAVTQGKEKTMVKSEHVPRSCR